MSRPYRDIVLHYADCDSFADGMTQFYHEVDQAIAAFAPHCQNRGLCCHFERFGHRLYVTAAEMAYFVRGLRDNWRASADRGSCPFQVGGLCVAREHRPLGCRIFHCDPAAQHWQNTEYERHLSRLKALSAKFGVPYSYREWLSALDEIGLEGEKTDDEALQAPSDSVRGVDLTPLTVIT